MASLDKGFKSLAVGGEGSGKTFLQWHEAKGEPHLIALEIHGGEIFKDVDAYVKNADEFKAALREYYAAKQAGKPYRITWSLSRTERDYPRILSYVIEAMRAAGGGALFIDESETFIPSRVNVLEDWAFQLAKHSRHLKIRTYMTAHKPTELHNKFRTNVTKSMYFYAKDKLTIGHIVEEEAANHTRADVLKLLKSLDKYEYLLSEGRAPLKKMKKIKNV